MFMETITTTVRDVYSRMKARGGVLPDSRGQKTNSIADDFEEMSRLYGIKSPPKVESRLNIPNARKELYYTMKYIVDMEQKDFKWLPEYEEVGDWLANDKGKGLFMYGSHGRGKTLLLRLALPMIIAKFRKKIIRPYDIQGMEEDLDNIIKRGGMVGLDDIGTEEIFNDFGTKREPFAEIIDHFEKNKGLILITTNLNKNELVERYGMRVLERIKSTTRRIAFEGQSLRGIK